MPDVAPASIVAPEDSCRAIRVGMWRHRGSRRDAPEMPEVPGGIATIMEAVRSLFGGPAMRVGSEPRGRRILLAQPHAQWGLGVRVRYGRCCGVRVRVSGAVE